MELFYLCNTFGLRNFFVQRVYMSVSLGSSVDSHGAIGGRPLSRDVGLKGSNLGGRGETHEHVYVYVCVVIICLPSSSLPL